MAAYDRSLRTYRLFRDPRAGARALSVAVLAITWLTACTGGMGGIGAKPAPTAAPPALDKELVFYGWPDGGLQSIGDAFKAEYGVTIRYETFSSQEEALASLRAGRVYDIVNLENQLIPLMISEGRLAVIDRRNIPNFKNLSANFRDLAFDPGSRHSIANTWGTSGLVIRTDLVTQPITGWISLWDPRYAGRVAVPDQMRDTLGTVLKSLGYSVNSENERELAQAEQRLLDLNRRAIYASDEQEIADLLVSGKVVIALGWSGVVLKARERIQTIGYVLPAEGTILWGDSLVIPANSPHKFTAETFLNFLLRPRVSAEVSNASFYATANEAASSYVLPGLLNDPVIYPPDAALRNSEVLLPLTPQGQKRYEEMWQKRLSPDN